MPEYIKTTVRHGVLYGEGYRRTYATSKVFRTLSIFMTKILDQQWCSGQQFLCQTQHGNWLSSGQAPTASKSATSHLENSSLSVQVVDTAYPKPCDVTRLENQTSCDKHA